MTIETRDFGTMELDENELVEFRSPIFGFESLKKFAILSDEDTEGLLWLQSVEDPSVCFILMGPDAIGLEYHPEIPQDIIRLLEIDKKMALQLIAVVPQDFRDTTVNLKSPIVINPVKKYAAQIILEADYPIRLHVFQDEEVEQC